VKAGTGTIAGLRCTTCATTWHARNGEICLTDDGVVLPARTGQNDTMREMVAVTVGSIEQPLALFAPPHGFENADRFTGETACVHKRDYARTAKARRKVRTAPSTVALISASVGPGASPRVARVKTPAPRNMPTN